ncbi:uncharacterized protein LOC119165550 isoform X2 [Rhipicephalus microplus]|uniref:uncharacterized protein LOC119165550 isoform X2 n=1 Tax=Rhipicephalus microplus TaxID=6941 RepID=UPI003F6D42F0
MSLLPAYFLLGRTARRAVNQFVNQMEPIWTSRTTRRRPVQCEVDKVNYVTPLSVSMNRCVYIRGNRCEMGILGVLDTEHKERMTIVHKDVFKTTETLLFMAFDHSCAVFKVESMVQWDIVYYDLRLRNSAVGTRPHPACQTYFQRVVGNQPTLKVYFNRCQRIFGQGI